MTATTYHAIRGLTARLAIGVLVLWALILVGVGIAQGTWPTGFSVDARP